MAKYFDEPTWSQKMKLRFTQLDRNRNGAIDDGDFKDLARQVAEYGSIPYDKAYKIITELWGQGLGEKTKVTPDEFAENMKAFVQRPDARERAVLYADMMFDTMYTREVAGHAMGLTYGTVYMFLKEVINMSDEMISTVFDKTDANKDNVISREEHEAGLMNLLFK
jgi:Ca2+-binding EF-hand superfamily protein